MNTSDWKLQLLESCLALPDGLGSSGSWYPAGALQSLEVCRIRILSAPRWCTELSPSTLYVKLLGLGITLPENGDSRRHHAWPNIRSSAFDTSQLCASLCHSMDLFNFDFFEEMD